MVILSYIVSSGSSQATKGTTPTDSVVGRVSIQRAEEMPMVGLTHRRKDRLLRTKLERQAETQF